MNFKHGSAVFSAVMGTFLFITLLFSNSYSLDKNPDDERFRGYDYPTIDLKKRTQWSFNAMYSERGFGVSAEYHINAWKNTDFFANLSFSGVTDSREHQNYDINGNGSTPNKVNRIFMVPLTIGFKHALFQDDIEGNFKPTFSAGVSPTLVLTNPARTNFFPALRKFNAAFAMGGFAGVGMDFVQTNNMEFSFNVNYYYLPVIGKEIESLEGRPIHNLGGLQFTLGVNLLR